MTNLHIPKAGYKTLTGGNYYVPQFGYISFAGAPPFSPSTNSLLQFGRNLDRARDRGFRS